MGNGEGSINIEDNNMIFVSSPEGAWGDTRSEVILPINLISKPLKDKLIEASEMGLKFA
jgi:hypothetical protein